MIVVKTPLRASFFGGGTDFEAYYRKSRLGYGTVLSTALKMFTYIMVCKRFDGMIRVCYREQELVRTVDEVRHNIIREAMKLTGVTEGVDIVYSADIPISTAGVGLASSSSMAVGVLNALSAYTGRRMAPDELAAGACDIEITRLGNPIGIQDQYAVAYGGFRQYTFHKNGDVTHDVVTCGSADLDALQAGLLLFYTGLTRLSSEILAEQQANIADRMSILDEMAQMADEAFRLLCRGDTSQWGRMLDRAWELKRQLAGAISNPQVDAMYAAARSAGAEGGKLLGAGGGGFLLLVVPPERRERVRAALRDFREVPVRFEPDGSRVVFAE